jgi:hypothetical protein
MLAPALLVFAFPSGSSTKIAPPVSNRRKVDLCEHAVLERSRRSVPSYSRFVSKWNFSEITIILLEHFSH